MKYENDKRKVYVNDYNIAIASLKLLSNEQKEELNTITNITSLLDKKKSYIDTTNTSFLNLKQYNNHIPNRILIPESEQIKTLITKKK